MIIKNKIIRLKDNAVDKNAVNPIRDFLLKQGVHPLHISDFLLKPSADLLDNGKLLHHIYRGLTIAKTAFENNEEVFMQVDSDADGYTSAAIIYGYFKKRYPNCTINFRVHEGKEHGGILETIPETASLIIIPDAGSSQVELQQQLVALGRKVLILDHHIITDFYEHPNVAVVSNQIDGFPNKTLSGAGVAWHFIKQYDELIAYSLFNNYIYQDFTDLAALGILSDMMDTRPIGTHYIVYHGLKHIRNQVFQLLLERQSYSIGEYTTPTKKDVVFYVTPIINGLVRFGKQEEKEEFFLALADDGCEGIYEHTYRGETKYESFYERAVRIATNAKNRQDASKKKSQEFLEAKIEEEELNRNSILVVPLAIDELDKVAPTITGLVANELSKEHNKPTLVLRKITDKDEHFLAGSGRWSATEVLPSFADFLKDTNLFEYVAGHDNAFGVKLKENNLPILLVHANNELPIDSLDSTNIYVDGIFQNDANTNFLNYFAQNQFLYGNCIEEPIFAFQFKVRYRDMYVMGKNQNSARIKFNGIDFVVFNDEDFIKTMALEMNCMLTVVGKVKLNVWQGKTNIQVIMDNYELRPLTAEEGLGGLF